MELRIAHRIRESIWIALRLEIHLPRSQAPALNPQRSGRKTDRPAFSRMLLEKNRLISIIQKTDPSEEILAYYIWRTDRRQIRRGVVAFSGGRLMVWRPKHLKPSPSYEVFFDKYTYWFINLLNRIFDVTEIILLKLGLQDYQDKRLYETPADQSMLVMIWSDLSIDV